MTHRLFLPVAVLAALAVALVALPSQAADRVTPGSFTGFAFDTCATPDRATMDTWLDTSPFWGVGVYIGGAERSCPQPNLDAGWVARQSRKGWRVLPIWVGPQAACSERDFGTDIIADRADKYRAARSQGRSNANAAVRSARELGIRDGSTLWYDIEDFPLNDATDPEAGNDCRRSVLSFLSAWTERLHRLGYRSGVYSNVAAAVDALDYADTVSPGSYELPDQIWYAWANGRADTRIDQRWVRGDNWMPHARIHQYALDTDATYGGVSLTIDRNFMDVGRGSVRPRTTQPCGVRIDFTDYRSLRRGSKGAQVKAAQCLLRKKRTYDGRVHGRFDRATYRAVRTFQGGRSLRRTGRLDAATWTVLLAEGRSPVLKRGSASQDVRRLQRALTAALDRKLPLTGVFDGRTARSVVRYQSGRGLPRTGVAAGATWDDLQAGRR